MLGILKSLCRSHFWCIYFEVSLSNTWWWHRLWPGLLIRSTWLSFVIRLIYLPSQILGITSPSHFCHGTPLQKSCCMFLRFIWRFQESSRTSGLWCIACLETYKNKHFSEGRSFICRCATLLSLCLQRLCIRSQLFLKFLYSSMFSWMLLKCLLLKDLASTHIGSIFVSLLAIFLSVWDFILVQ